MPQLDKQGRQLLKLLVDLLPSADPDRPEILITYTQVHDRLGLRILPGTRTAGQSLQAQGLNLLGGWTRDKGTPGITGLIINADGENKGMPGSGFWKLYGKKGTEWDWFREEIHRCKNYDWSPYLIASDVLRPLSLVQIMPSGEEGKRQLKEVWKIARKGDLRLEALKDNKNRYEGIYKCEACSFGDDSEGLFDVHHIVPLAVGHRKSTVADLLVLCPTCHRIAHCKGEHVLKPLPLLEIRAWLEVHRS